MEFQLTNIRKSSEEIAQIEELLYNYYSEVSGVYNNPKNVALAKKEARSEKFAVAVHRGKIVGFVRMGKSSVSMYYLRPEFRGQNIFGELRKFAETKIKESFKTKKKVIRAVEKRKLTKPKIIRRKRK
jgi:GNAT superfamily N-acetyltransferase